MLEKLGRGGCWPGPTQRVEESELRVSISVRVSVRVRVRVRVRVSPLAEISDKGFESKWFGVKFEDMISGSDISNMHTPGDDLSTLISWSTWPYSRPSTCTCCQRSFGANVLFRCSSRPLVTFETRIFLLGNLVLCHPKPQPVSKEHYVSVSRVATHPK